MKTIDITIDFETFSLLPTAAPVTLGAVAWDKNTDIIYCKTPFIENGGDILSFRAAFDMRECALAGLSFDRETMNWWSQQSAEAKKALIADEPQPIRDVIEGLKDFVSEAMELSGADSFNLWCQGTDFDLSILKMLFHVSGLNLGKWVHHWHFRDHRTYCLEAAEILSKGAERQAIIENPRKAYDFLASLTEQSLPEQYNTPHDPITDCARSAFSTWIAYQTLHMQTTPMSQEE